MLAVAKQSTDEEEGWWPGSRVSLSSGLSADRMTSDHAHADPAASVHGSARSAGFRGP